MTVAIKRWRCSVRDYYRMLDTGILTEDSRVELIDGEIVEMAPISSAHAAAVKRLNRLLTMAVGDRAIVSVQDPLRLDEWSEPEPDHVLLRPRADYYATSHPTPDDVLLAVEVARSSLGYDRNKKRPLYARAGVPELWIVNLSDAVIEVYRVPSGARYEQVEMVRRGGTVAPEALPDVIIAVDDVLGPDTS